MRRIVLVVPLLALVACGGHARLVDVPSNHGRSLDSALRRLHEAGLRASFPAASTACGDALPWVNVQSPRAPARAREGSTVTIRFGPTPIPSPSSPIHHAKRTTVPDLVGLEFSAAEGRLHAVWPCVHVRAASSTDALHVVVVAESPHAGTRVPAYGVLSGRGYRPTTVELIFEARG